MNARTYASRIKHLRTILVRKKLDAFVAFTHQGNNKNVQYLSGFGGTSALLIITKHEAVIATDPRYRLRARIEARAFALFDLAPRQGFSDVIREILGRSEHRRKQRIGYEGHHVSVLTAYAWKKKIPHTLMPLENVVGRLRQYKDRGEIESIRHACRVTSRVFEEVRKRIRPGMKESDVAFDIDMALRKYGAIENGFSTIVASGPNSAIPHHNTGNRRVKSGEPVVMDFGGRFSGGYCSDLTRTIFVPGKKADPELLKVYAIVLEANRAAFRAVKADMTWKDYDAVARSYIQKHGYEGHFTHSLGHSLGLEAHDPFDYTSDEIIPGTVFTNEPGIYIEGRGGVRIEDDLVMTRKGPERLTTASYKM